MTSLARTYDSDAGSLINMCGPRPHLWPGPAHRSHSRVLSITPVGCMCARSTESTVQPKWAIKKFGEQHIHGFHLNGTLKPLTYRYIHLKSMYLYDLLPLFLSRLTWSCRNISRFYQETSDICPRSSPSRMMLVTNTSPTNTRKVTLFIGTSTCSSALRYHHARELIDSAVTFECTPV